MRTPIRIAIADDHAVFREGLKLLLKKLKTLGIELTGEAENGQKLLAVVEKHMPHVVLTDIQMPLMDGIEASRRLKKAYPEIGIIALTAFNESTLVMDMLQAGASGYLLKNTNKEELFKAIMTVQRGGVYYCAETSAHLAKQVTSSTAPPGKKVTPLTARETQIVKLVCQGYVNKEIASLLGLSKRTVESHREKILERIGARSSAELIVYAVTHNVYQP